MTNPDFILEFITDGAAFEDQSVAETARILRDTAERIEGGQLDGKVYDINGNYVGSFRFNG